MASVLKVDKLDPQSGTALEIGTSGDTITVPTGAGLTVVDEVKTNKISPSSGVAFTLGDSGDTFTIPSGATITNSGTATGFGLDGTPNFLAYRSSSDQSISDATWTKVEFQSESYDTDSAYDNSTNYRFTVPAGEGGKYFLYSHVWMRGTDVSMMNYYYLSFYKNGSNIWEDHCNFTNNDIRSFGSQLSLTTDLSATDYIEVFGKISINSGTPSFGNDAATGVPTTWFQGIRLA